jgi:anaerobic dimethyl sulfoxide reductase subunit A
MTGGGETTERVPFTCTLDCWRNCDLVACVRAGRVVRIDAPGSGPPAGEAELVPCAVGRARRRSLDAPERVLVPLRRSGPRGSGRFEEIGWYEALDEVAERLADVRRRHGAEAVLHLAGYGSLGGSGVSGCAASLRFFSHWASVTGTRGDPSTWCHGVVADWMLKGRGAGSIDPADLADTRLIVLWGANPAETGGGARAVADARDRYVGLRPGRTNGRDRGARVILVDPRLTDSGALADRWIPVRPGTDAALVAAIGHVWESEGHTDTDFMATHTSGYEGYRRYILGDGDGVPKTPEWAERVTGAPAGIIREFAREYAEASPALLLAGFGPQRSLSGEQTERALITLACMSGNLGVPGGGIAWRVAGTSMGPALRALPAGPFRPARAVREENWAAEVLAGTLDPPVRMAYIVASNVINRNPDTRANVRALERLDAVIIHEQFLTPTARHADVVLPICTDLERPDLIVGGGVHHNRRVVPPRGESRSDYWVFARLAERLGIGEAYTEGRSEQKWIEELISTGDLDAGTLRRDGVLRYGPVRGSTLAAFRKDPAAHPLRTPSGLIEIALPQAKDHGLPELPVYVEDAGAEEEWPLQLVTPHHKSRVNSCEHANGWLARLEPHALWMNPRDAAPRLIESGNLVEVASPSGVVAVPAKVTERIMPGVVCLYQGAWYRPGEGGVDEGGCANVLTSSRLSPTGGMAAHSARVEVRRRGT